MRRWKGRAGCIAAAASSPPPCQYQVSSPLDACRRIGRRIWKRGRTTSKPLQQVGGRRQRAAAVGLPNPAGGALAELARRVAGRQAWPALSQAHGHCRALDDSPRRCPPPHPPHPRLCPPILREQATRRTCGSRRRSSTSSHCTHASRTAAWVRGWGWERLRGKRDTGVLLAPHRWLCRATTCMHWPG